MASLAAAQEGCGKPSPPVVANAAGMNSTSPQCGDCPHCGKPMTSTRAAPNLLPQLDDYGVKTNEHRGADHRVMVGTSTASANAAAAPP
eukprot:NODE_18667_length_882_cov_3.392053.p2 GENE.NODE_18667_length_882_cov_3.392053~~NODE_18667_length_882_cov_3.392053.p2  ORF type:complete len:89 (+),score=13.43 NODE_18667_length_882_cov_3.392053:290-556(+)